MSLLLLIISIGIAFGAGIYSSLSLSFIKSWTIPIILLILSMIFGVGAIVIHRYI